MNRLNRHCLALTLLLAPAFVAAQTAPTSTSVVPATKAANVVPVATSTTGDEPKQVEAFEVTGSRIRLNAGEAPAIPIFSLDRIQLEELGVNRLADIRQAIPQLAPAIGFNDNLVNGGPSRGQMSATSFNLRGLGGNSTLVLVDGNRIPHSGQEAPGGAGGREDFNVDGIPVNAIERIEILPQGASAIYGSEAIGGVVNIILKKIYTGAQLGINYDNTFDKDVGQTSISLTAGLTRGKLRTFLTANWERQNSLMSRDRWFSATADTTRFGAAAQPAFFLQQPPLVGGLLSSTNSPQNAGQANLPGLATNFVSIPAGAKGAALPIASYAAGVWPARFDPNRYSTLIDPARRRSFVFKGDYQVTPSLQAYASLRWARFENYHTGTPVTFNAQSLPAGYPGNPFPSAVFLKKVFLDLQSPQQNSYHDNSGAVVGVRGTLPGNWRYDASYSYARNVIFDDTIAAGFNFPLLNAAINNTDPTKRPIFTYDSSAPGNDPNPAGYLASLMPAFDHRDVTQTHQTVVRADGKVWSLWAGDINAALGAESSEEKVKFNRDPRDTRFLTQPFSRRLLASFAEVRLPLLATKQQVPLVHRLEVSGAVRAEDFSDLGGHNTPQYNATFQPVKWLTARASRAEGFKAPKLYDLQGPITTGTATLTTASNVRDTLRGGELVLGTVNSISGGNPGLNPETSVSKGGGIVIDVPGQWFQGLTLSYDRWQTYYVNKIGSASRQVLIDFFPGRVTRGPSIGGQPGLITGFDTSNLNLANQKARGVDAQLSYRRRFSFGQLSASIGYTDQVPQVTQSTPAAVPTSAFGQQPWRTSGSLFWTRSAWGAGTTMSYQARYYISGLANANFAYPSLLLWNPQISYDFSKNPAYSERATNWWTRALAGCRVSLTVPNVFNREPSMTEALNSRVVMDQRLRRYVINLSKKL